MRMKSVVNSYMPNVSHFGVNKNLKLKKCIPNYCFKYFLLGGEYLLKSIFSI